VLLYILIACDTFLSITLVPEELEHFYLHKKWLEFDFQSKAKPVQPAIDN
jgi:hypothetical protein